MSARNCFLTLHYFTFLLQPGEKPLKIVTEYTKETKIDGVIDNVEDRSPIQCNLDCTVSWVKADNLCPSMTICKVIHVGTNNAGLIYWMGNSLGKQQL